MFAWGNMTYRKAVFAVVYAIENNKIYYLILKRKLHWKGWEFTKGGVEKNETYSKAAKREVYEETGQKPRKIKSFNISGKYKYHKLLKDRPGFIGQEYKLFSAQISKGKIKLDKKEHSGFKWLSYNLALKKLTWSNQKKCLKIVNNFLSSNRF